MERFADILKHCALFCAVLFDLQINITKNLTATVKYSYPKIACPYQGQNLKVKYTCFSFHILRHPVKN